MSALILPSTRTTQPQGVARIDWSNPLTRNLSFAFNAADLRDVVSDRLYSSMATMSRSYFKDGCDLTSTVTASNIQFPTSTSYVSDITIITVCRPTVLSADGYIVSKNTANGATNTPFGFGVGNYANGQLLFAIANASGFRVKASTTSIPTLQTKALAVTHTGGIEIAPVFYIDGKKDTSTIQNLYSGVGTGAATDNANNIYIGNRNDLTTPFYGRVYVTLIYTRVLTDAEIASLSQNPWQIFAPQQRRLWVVPASGLSLTLNTLAQVQILQTLSLTQENNINTIAITQQSSLQTPNLTQANIMTVDDTADTQSLGDVSLNQDNSLVTNSLIQQQNVSSVELLQQNILNIFNTQTTQNTDLITLAQQNVLSLGPLLQEQILTTPGLTQQNILSLLNIIQIQSLDVINLTQQHVLNIFNSAQQQVLDAIIISSGLVLETQTITINQNIQSIALLQNNVLGITNVTQTETLNTLNLIQANALTITSILETTILGNITLVTQTLLDVNNTNQTESLQNLVLLQANLLNVNNILETTNITAPTLSNTAILIVSDLLHSQLAQSIVLTYNITTLEFSGQTIYVVKGTTDIYILHSNTVIYMPDHSNTSIYMIEQ